MPDYRRRKVREAASVLVDVNGVMAEVLGEGGFQQQELASLASRVATRAAQMRAQRKKGELPFMDLPHAADAVRPIRHLAEELRQEADTMVVLGIGGSALGTRAVFNAVPGDRRVIVADNIDPWSFGRALDGVDLERTVFNVISKSGETAETMAQFLVVRDLLLKTFGAVQYGRHVVVTTDAERGHLRQIVSDEGFRAVTVPDGIGGRFSVLSAVGLLPAAFGGLAVETLLAGAAWMDERVSNPEMWRNPAYMLAAVLSHAWMQRGKTAVVFMPYSDRLVQLGAWFVQLWAESLGKREALDGREVNTGQTPILAVGATDQHAQMQLFAEGPDDKIYVLVRVENHVREIVIPPSYTDLDGVSYLGEKTLGTLLNMEEQASEVALAKRGRMVIRLTVPHVDLFTLGQLFYLWEVAVAVVGGLADVNAFDQPGVEEGKHLTYGLAGRQGFADKKQEVDAWMARRRPEYVL